jgi:putative selenate reductase
VIVASAAERLLERIGRAASHADAGALLARAAALYDEMVAIAGALNTAPIVERVNADPRYAAAKNRGTPRKVGTHLVLYDCVSCNKCVPVCPNDANFRFDVEPIEVEYSEIVVTTRGPAVIPRGLFRVERASQWATYADFCNECGNCDVFCPEEGGPYLEKPRFFSSEETYRAVAPQSGFLITRDNGATTIRGRIGGREYALRTGKESAHLSDEWIDAEVDSVTGAVRLANIRSSAPLGHSLTLDVFFILQALLRGALDERRTNYLNV